MRPIDADALLDVYTSLTYRTTIYSMKFVQAISKTPTIGMVTCWTPCSKELPKQGGEYLCTVQTRDPATNKVTDEFINFVDFDDGYWQTPIEEHVTAWMHMPEIYKENEQDETSN